MGLDRNDWRVHKLIYFLFFLEISPQETDFLEYIPFCVTWSL